MPKKKSKSRAWFNSTLITLLIIFVAVVTLGVFRYGWETVLDESLKYIIGATFTAIVIYIAGFIFKDRVRRWLK